MSSLTGSAFTVGFDVVLGACVVTVAVVVAVVVIGAVVVVVVETPELSAEDEEGAVVSDGVLVLPQDTVNISATRSAKSRNRDNFFISYLSFVI